MKKITLFLPILFMSLLFSCKQNGSTIDPENPLIGIWVYRDYQQISNTEYAIVYERKSKFDENNSGIFFKANNKLIERKNSGWCGTPPISYGEYNGSYSLEDKKIIADSDGWNGRTIQKYEIISIDDKLLKIKRLN